MSEDRSLFGDDGLSTPSEPVRTPLPIADWQIDLLRKALDVRGITTMAKRQQVIESAAGRAVESLRALTHDEAFQALSRLGQKPATGRPVRSAWDDGDDTWIDRL